MRSFRVSVLALAALGLAPAPLGAQQAASGWQDSWYWGGYYGYTSFATTIARTNAPTIGVDWVITRSRYALNVFAEQSYFSAVSTVPDFPTSAPRRVDITDMRRVGFSAMIFTPEWKQLKPYLGLGWSFNFIKDGTPQGSYFATPAARDTVLDRINSARSMGKFFGNVGFMWMNGKYAPFAQYTIMPTKGTGDWMVNGNGFTNIWSAGMRYNFGSAIDKKW